MLEPGVEDHGQSNRGDALPCSGASCTHNSAALGFELYSQRFGNAAKKHVQDSKLVPVTLLCGVNDITDVGWWQGLDTNNASQANRCYFWEDTPQQGGHLEKQRKHMCINKSMQGTVKELNTRIKAVDLMWGGGNRPGCTDPDQGKCCSLDVSPKGSIMEFWSKTSELPTYLKACKNLENNTNRPVGTDKSLLTC